METSIFDCTICWFQYNDTNRKPISLPWGHVLCNEWLNKIIPLDQSKVNLPSEIRKNLILEEMSTQIICPIDSLTHKIVPSSLPIWYAIMQHLPKQRDAKDFTTWHTNRLPTATSDFSNEESDKLKKEFRSILKHYTDEYRWSKHWEETLKLLEKRHIGTPFFIKLLLFDS